MGDSDGSSNAAQGAQSDANLTTGLFQRIRRAFRGTTDNPVVERPSEPDIARDGGFRSLANLTRLRVDGLPPESCVNRRLQSVDPVQFFDGAHIHPDLDPPVRTAVDMLEQQNVVAVSQPL